MSNDKAEPMLVSREAGERFIASTDDTITRQLLQLAYEEARACFESGEYVPIVDFDLHYFLESLRSVFDKHVTLCRILAGEDVATNDYW